MAGALTYRLGRTSAANKRFWRLRFPSGSPHATDLGLSEIEMRSTVGGSDLTSSANAVASSDQPSFVKGKAFDNSFTNTDSWFCTSGADVDSWIGNDLSSSTELLEFIVTAHGTDSTYGPSEMVFEYSPDGSAWTTDTRWPTMTGLRWSTGAPGETKKIRRTDTGLSVINVAGRPLFNADDNGWTPSYTIRSPIAAAAVPGEGGNRVRFALQPSSTGGLVVSDAYVGILSGTYGGTLTRATFNGGSNGFSASSGGAVQWSDDVTLTTASTDGLIIVYAVNGNFRKAGGANTYYKTGNDASNTSPSGYFTWAGIEFVVGLERWTA